MNILVYLRGFDKTQTVLDEASNGEEKEESTPHDHLLSPTCSRSRKSDLLCPPFKDPGYIYKSTYSALHTAHNICFTDYWFKRHLNGHFSSGSRRDWRQILRSSQAP